MENRDILPVLLLVLVLVAALTGCADAVTPQPDPIITDSKTAPSPTPLDIPDLRPSQTLPVGTEHPELNPVVGEVPPKLLDEIIADLAGSTGAQAQSIQVIRAEAVVWNDGSLGCPKPGEFYIQMLLDGYWVVLKVEGVYYDYRVSDDGYFFKCEVEGSPPISPPDMEVPLNNPLISQAKEDLAERLDVPVEEIELLSFEEVVWGDTSMGCPQPGMRYLQVPQDGALIQLGVEGQVYDYHSGGSREPFLCEQTVKAPKTTPIDLDDFPPTSVSEDE